MKVTALDFVSTILVNVDNENLSDKDFRQFIRNTLPIIEKQPLDKISDGLKKQIEKYYK